MRNHQLDWIVVVFFRIIINTLSNVLALNFERVEFNYSLGEDKPDILSVRNRQRPATVPVEGARAGGGGGRVTGPRSQGQAHREGHGPVVQLGGAGYKQTHSFLRAQKMKQVVNISEI